MTVIDQIKNEGLRRGLRYETIKTYSACIRKFQKTYHKNLFDITQKDIEKYLSQMQKWGKADNTINVHINALKFLYEKVLRKKGIIQLYHKKIRKSLPTFLTKEETKNLFSVITNNKHLLLIKLLYATGMRVSELVSLKVHDFEFNDNYGWVRDGKGGKDRMFIISKKLKEELLDLISSQKMGVDSWLFPGQNGSHYSVSSIQAIIRNVSTKAKIRKNVSPHTLRHSFATHLIENGYAITDVQPLLGHNSINTTMIYLHMASPQLLHVKSPFDTL